MEVQVDNKTISSINKATDNLLKYKNMQDYKLASHNTMSYLTPRTLLDRIIAFTAKCQSKTIKEQIEDYGVKLVDLRFKFNKKGQIFFAHGAIEYKGKVSDTLEYLNSFKDFPVRIMLENKPGEHETTFKTWCAYLERTYHNIKFFGGRNKWTWKELYKFKNEHPSVEDKYSSCNVNEPGKSKTGTIIDDLCPIWYAKKHNRKNRIKGTDKEYLMIDFVEIK